MLAAKPDTSPKIAAEGYKFNQGRLVADNACAVTVVYDVKPSGSIQPLKGEGLIAQLALYKDGVYFDYWTYSNPNISANANGMAATVQIAQIDNSYLYIKETGEIIFAGKNTIYYGHRNISEIS